MTTERTIKRNSEFLALKKNGRRHWPANWLLLNFTMAGKDEVGSPLRFGVTASRKVGKAVVRNRLKRWCREYFRGVMQEPDSRFAHEFGVQINVIFKPMDQGFYKGLSHPEFLGTLERGLEYLRKSAARDRADHDRRV